MIVDFIGKLWKTKSLQNTFIVMFASAISSILGFVFIALVARNLGPSDFGRFSTLVNYVVFLSLIADLGISQSVVRFVQATKDFLERKRWLSTAFVLATGIITSISLLAALVYRFYLANLWRHPVDYNKYVWILIVLIALGVWSLAIFQAIKKFVLRGVVDNVFGVVRLLFAIYIIKIGIFSPEWGFGSIIIGYIVSLIVTIYFLRSYLSFKYVKSEYFAKLINFGKWLAFYNIFVNLGMRLDIMMLSGMTNDYLTGIYSAAARFMTIFAVIISSLTTVFAPEFSAIKEKKQAKKYLYHSLFISVSIAIGSFILILLGKWIILTAYGLEYIAAIPIFKWLIVANLPLILVLPFSNMLIYFFKLPQRLVLIVAVQVLLMGLLNLLFIPNFHLFGPVYSLMLGNILMLFATIYLVTKSFYEK